MMRAIIEISKNNLINNYKYIKEKTKKDVIAVIKSNAYGHGLLEVTRILSSLNPKMFSVSSIDEAIAIRKNLIFTPILLLGATDNLKAVFNHRITLSIINITYLKNVAKSNLKINVHLLINTSLNRDGIEVDEIDEAINIINNSNLVLKGFFTHVADPLLFEEVEKIFNECISKYRASQHLVHIQASSTAFFKSSSNAVRVGLMLYGLTTDCNLKPVLSLKCFAINEIRVEKNQKVSYNLEPCKNDGYIYTLPIGYADGLKRNYRHTVFVNNKPLKQIGITCMDHIMVFSKNKLPQTTTFELIGDNLNVITLAKNYRTIPYEIVSKLSYRLKRVTK